MSENRVDAVERALLILDSFKEGEDSLTLAAMAERTSLYKSTILRLAGSLERFGYLVRDSGGVYHLGPSLWRLGSLYRRSFDLGGHIRPELRRIVQATSETAAFYVREGKERVCLYRVNSPRSVRHHLDEGVRLPLNRGAAGRVLLAYDGIRGEPYKRIRQNGYYTSLGERDPETAAVAVPVFDTAQKLRGALSSSAPLSRFDAEAHSGALKALRESADRLEASLTRD